MAWVHHSRLLYRPHEPHNCRCVCLFGFALKPGRIEDYNLSRDNVRRTGGTADSSRDFYFAAEVCDPWSDPLRCALADWRHNSVVTAGKCDRKHVAWTAIQTFKVTIPNGNGIQ